MTGWHPAAALLPYVSHRLLPYYVVLCDSPTQQCGLAEHPVGTYLHFNDEPTIYCVRLHWWN